MTQRHLFRKTSAPAGGSLNVGGVWLLVMATATCPGPAQEQEQETGSAAALVQSPAPAARAGQPVADTVPTPSADELRQKADRFFQQREFLRCGHVCEAITRQHPESEHAIHAEFLVARMYEALGKQQKALAALQAIAERNPDSPVAVTARNKLPVLLFNAGRKKEAIQQEKANAAAARDDYTRANLYYNAGSLAKGVDDVEAIACFSKVRDEYPETPFAAMARGALEEMNKRTLSEIEKDLFGE